ncbi:MAG: LPS export ABC transporter periplasmic protein LptC [Thiotrichaceae bacterium]
MRYSGIIFLVLAVIVAGAATWLHNLWRTQQVFTEKLDTSKVDYYLSDFSLYITDTKGKSRFSLSGEHFIHQRSSKKSVIYKPSIVVNYEGDTLNIVAKNAEQNADGDIELKGKVLIDKPESEARMGFKLEAADLLYSPSKQRINTDAKILLKTTEGSIITAIGMSEDLSTQTTRLKSNVHAEYAPAIAE